MVNFYINFYSFVNLVLLKRPRFFQYARVFIKNIQEICYFVNNVIYSDFVRTHKLERSF